MPGLLGFPSPLRDVILGGGASALTEPSAGVTYALPNSPEWFAELNDARGRAFPRGKAPSLKEPAIPPAITYKQATERVIPTAPEPSSKTGATNWLKVVFGSPSGVTFS